MAEYTYEDIIMDPEDPRLEGAIGKECFFADYPMRLLENARSNSSVVRWYRLKSISKDEKYPFADHDGHTWTLIIIKKEEPKPKYMPFKDMYEFVNRYFYLNTNDNEQSLQLLNMNAIWLRYNNNAIRLVTDIWTDGVYLGSDRLKTKWEELLKCYTFLDGSPCGKLAEENKNGNSFDR